MRTWDEGGPEYGEGELSVEEEVFSEGEEGEQQLQSCLIPWWSPT